tara:strand:- start:54737 stop:54907 length:171 start_codon:yes stop_codon:yes gene_type:complete
MDIPPTIEGLRHARNQLYKQWQKEKQRVASLRQTIAALEAEVAELKKKSPHRGGIH